MAMPPNVISVTVAQHAPAPMMSMTPTTASCDVHADARSAITVTPAIAAPPLPHVDARTHAYVRAAAEIGSSANDRSSAALALDDRTATAAARTLDRWATTPAAALNGSWRTSAPAPATTAPALLHARAASAAAAASSTSSTFTLALGVRRRTALRQHDAGIGVVNRRRGRRSRSGRRRCRQCQSQQARAGEICTDVHILPSEMSPWRAKSCVPQFRSARRPKALSRIE